MAQAATFNDEIYRALRDSGIEERHAMRAARAVPPADSIATKADLADLRAAMPDRDAERDAARADRKAEREADREVFAAKSDVAVLQNRVETVEAAIISINKTLERMDERLDHMDRRIDVVEEKISSIRTLLFAIYTPLILLILASQFGLLTKGILWAVAP